MDSKNHSRWMMNTTKQDVTKKKTRKMIKWLKGPQIHHHLLHDTLTICPATLFPLKSVMSSWHSGIPEENTYIDPKLNIWYYWLNMEATAQGKQGNWMSIFPDMENTGNLATTQGKNWKHREKNLTSLISTLWYFHCIIVSVFSGLPNWDPSWGEGDPLWS